MLFLAAFGPADWGVIAVYLGLMGLIGFRASRRRGGTRDYFLAERQMPTAAVALSVVATSLSVATFNGAPQEAFKGDLTYLSLNIGGFLAVLVVATLFIPRLYRAGSFTIYGFIEQRFGQTSRVAISAMFLIGRLLASGVRLFIAAIPLCLLIFHTFDPNFRQLATAIVLVGIVGMSYTVAGGVRAVIWTDTVQIVIVAGTVMISIALLLHWIPLPLHSIVHLLQQPTPDHPAGKLRWIDFSTSLNRENTFWTAIIGATFLNTAAYGVDQDLAQRMLTARTPLLGGLSLLLAQCVGLIVVAMFLIVGLLLYIFYQRPDAMGAARPSDVLQNSMGVYPQFLLAHMPSGLAGLAIAGMFAAAQGSLDSAINAMAGSAVADLYWPWRRWRGLPVDEQSKTASRAAVVITGFVLIASAIVSAWRYDSTQRSLLVFALGVMSFAYTGMLGVFLTALLTRRGTTGSVLSALVTGVVVTTLMQDSILSWWSGRVFHFPLQLSIFWWMPIGTVLSFLVCVTGSPASAKV